MFTVVLFPYYKQTNDMPLDW